MSRYTHWTNIELLTEFNRLVCEQSNVKALLEDLQAERNRRAALAEASDTAGKGDANEVSE